MSFEIAWKENDIIMTFYGELTLSDLQRANDLVYGDSRFDKMKYQIVDFSDVSSTNVLIDEVEVISALDEEATHWNKSVKVACVTTDEFIKKMVLVYTKEMQNTNWSCEIFENFDDAQKWCSE